MAPQPRIATWYEDDVDIFAARSKNLVVVVEVRKGMIVSKHSHCRVGELTMGMHPSLLFRADQFAVENTVLCLQAQTNSITAQ